MSIGLFIKTIKAGELDAIVFPGALFVLILIALIFVGSGGAPADMSAASSLK